MTTIFPFERIPAPLLAWYQTHKRDLAWRNDPTPYHIWVSEIMLQQTRVEAVKDYYARFIAELPDVQALAACEEERLLKLWEGLGYYSRVRNLQKAARESLYRFNGEFPQNKADLRSLSGIGDYTAGAIASIAFKKRAAAVDGNVLRVVSRLAKDGTPISDMRYRKRIEAELSAAYPKAGKACSDFTQSLFELGALVCKPQNPDCAKCPLQEICRAYKNGTQPLYPVLPQKKEKRLESVYIFLIQTDEGFCIRRRETGVLKGMNEFPSAVQTNESAESVLNEWGVYAFTEKKRKKYKHIFTHIIWDITCVWVQTEFAPFDTYTLDEIQDGISLPTAFKQCLELINDEKI